MSNRFTHCSFILIFADQDHHVDREADREVYPVTDGAGPILVIVIRRYSFENTRETYEKCAHTSIRTEGIFFFFFPSSML